MVLVVGHSSVLLQHLVWRSTLIHCNTSTIILSNQPTINNHNVEQLNVRFVAHNGHESALCTGWCVVNNTIHLLAPSHVNSPASYSVVMATRDDVIKRRMASGVTSLQAGVGRHSLMTCRLKAEAGKKCYKQIVPPGASTAPSLMAHSSSSEHRCRLGRNTDQLSDFAINNSYEQEIWDASQ